MNVHGSKWIRPEKRLAIYIRDGFSCAYCGASLKGAAPAEVTLDHLLPRSQGGTHESSNLVTACRRCNSSRGDEPITQFAPAAAERVLALRALPINVRAARFALAAR